MNADGKQSKPHEHVYVIPVEWASTGAAPSYDGSGHVTLVNKGYSVTRLRCECGEEIAR